jgi:hypothetical protein
MTPFLQFLDQVFNLVALVGLGGALVVIAWVGENSSEQGALTWGAALGILGWLVGIGFALYLILG